MIYSKDDVRRILNDLQTQLFAKGTHTDPYGQSTMVISLRQVELEINKIKERL